MDEVRVDEVGAEGPDLVLEAPDQAEAHGKARGIQDVNGDPRAPHRVDEPSCLIGRDHDEPDIDAGIAKPGEQGQQMTLGPADPLRLDDVEHPHDRR